MNRSSAAAASGITYRTVTVSTGNVKQTVSATGTIEPAATEDLSFGSSGEVTSVRVVEGQKVTKGQVLATLSSAALTSQVAQAKATLAAAEARLDADESASASSQQLAADRASITVAMAQLADARAALAGARLTSPITGTVTAVNVTAGEQISGSGSTGNGSTGSNSSNSSNSSSGANGGSGSNGSNGSGSANGSNGSSGSSGSTGSSSADIQVISTGSYVVNATVDATDVANVAKGDQVTITPTGASTSVFGLVTSVGIVASSSSGSATFPVVVTVTGSPTGLYAGGTADLTITYKQVSNVLVVPTLAITRSNGASYVTVDSNGTRTQKEITTGLSSGGSTEVKSGLSAGDTVVVVVRTATGDAGTGTNRTGNGQGGFGGGGFGPPGGFVNGGPPAGGFGGNG
jgi:membrane fusion protein, macrolide-specific efflux system